MAEVTFINPEAATKMANGFGEAANTMRAISKALDVAIAALKAASFFSLGSTMLEAMYLENIQKPLDELAKLSDQAKEGIIGARNYLVNGDETGSTMFR